MRIRWGRSAWLTLLLTGFALAQPNPGNPVHTTTDRQRDVYAIYSMLVPGAVFTNLGSSQNQRWAIADTTVNLDDMNPALAPDAALQAPGNNPKLFQEALADFNARKYQRDPLTRSFHLDRPYVLLAPAEVQEFRATRTSMSPDSSLQQKYSGYPGITYFSDVYFSAHRTAALVYRLDWCGSLCSQGEWIYLEKQSGHWVQRSGQAAIASGARAF